jgi:hypothetical protein
MNRKLHVTRRSSFLPTTSQRVPAHTPRSSNARILRDTKARIAYYAGHHDEIADRLEELEREWDIERTLEVNGSLLAATGIALGVYRDPRWFLLPTAVVGFCLQHALQGWCPPLPFFRRMGIRSQREIDEERYALMALRGDLVNVAKGAGGRTTDPGALLSRLRGSRSGRGH